MKYGLIAGIVVAAVAFGIYWTLVREKPTGLEEIKPIPAPSLLLKDYDGQEINLSDFRGKNAIINSWAGWCPFCVDELPDFAAIQKEFKDQVVVVAVNRAEPLETAKFFSDKVGVTGRLVLLLDPSDSFYQAIGGFSMPETIFTDKDGFIRFHKRGPMKLEELKRRMEELL